MTLNKRYAPYAIPGITDMPPSGRGMRIGLFGGSFNPAHEGHVLVAEQALRRLQLDQLWVLVTPGNPLKSHNDLAPLAERVQDARRLLDDPRIRVTGFEAEHGFKYSFQTILYLKQALPDRHFVWIMGADNLAGLHRWQRWDEIARLVPMAIYVRPGSSLAASSSRAAQTLARFRVDEGDAPGLALRPAPAWVYLHGLQSGLSSSAIRARKPRKSGQ